MTEIRVAFCNLRTTPKPSGVYGTNILICTTTKHKGMFQKINNDLKIIFLANSEPMRKTKQSEIT
jgi:hypothetical protein